MSGKSCKQVYLGRVIYPAKYIEGNQNKPFLSFEICVDGVGWSQDKAKVTVKIPCTYTIQGDKDPVASILCNIRTKDEEDTACLGDYVYTTVDVIVEGNERLVQVVDGSGNHIPRAFYKSLDYCTVTVVDREVISAYYVSIGENKKLPNKKEIQLPNKAPVTFKKPLPNKATKEKEIEVTQVKRKGYKPGDTCNFGGKIYQYVGGIPEEISSWREVIESEEDNELPPFAVVEKNKQGSKHKNSVRAILNEDNERSPFDDDEDPVV